MSKFAGCLVVLIVLGGTVAYGAHLWQNYEFLKNEAREEAAVRVIPHIYTESVSEIGYIFDMRRENHIRDKYRNLVWFVAVPATGERFACVYSAGFPDFKVGDGVTIIHNTQNPDEAETSYIVGLHDQRLGKVAEVGTNDLDLSELEDPGGD